MAEPLQVRLGGYAPRETTHGRALDRIASGLREGLGDAVEIAIDYNVLDSGRQVQALLDDVAEGRTTLCYFSTSYLADRVPVIGVVDLPYLFESLDHAHACLDGALGRALTERTGSATGLLALGYWDNGFRHLSTRSRAVRSPADCRGLRIRLQPNWAHEQFFRELGADPMTTDLRDGIDKLRTGELDAQENPLANFVTYGVHELHPYVTLTGHAFGARGVYASARQLDGWPDRCVRVLAEAVSAAVVEQRADAARTEVELRTQLATSGSRIIELGDDEARAFRGAALPVLRQAEAAFGADLLDLARR